MAKYDDLIALKIDVLRRALEWLNQQRRVFGQFENWSKDRCVDELARKLTVDQVAKLVKAAELGLPRELLAQSLGIPQKETMLDLASHGELKAIMSRLASSHRVDLAWKALNKRKLSAYLKTKFTVDELAAELGYGTRVLGVENAKSKEAPKTATQREAESSLKPGVFQLPGYEICRRLEKQGGMGESYEGVELATGKKVFLKLTPTCALAARALERECQIYQKLHLLRSDYVLRVQDFIRKPEFTALVLEFADGPDLESFVINERDGALSPIVAKPILLEIAAGISGLHSNQIVHRDLKPSNIIRHDQRWRLTDFGIGKNTQRLITLATLRPAGTLGFMPPEQENGAEAHPAMDMYAFGKVLTFMLTGGTDPDRIAYRSWRDLAVCCTNRENPEKRFDIRNATSIIEGLAV